MLENCTSLGKALDMLSRSLTVSLKHNFIQVEMVYFASSILFHEVEIRCSLSGVIANKKPELNIDQSWQALLRVAAFDCVYSFFAYFQ